MMRGRSDLHVPGAGGRERQLPDPGGSDPHLPGSIPLLDLGVYLVTDRELCGPRGVPATVAAAVTGGVRTVQLRDKQADLEDHLRQLTDLAEVIDGRAWLLVNDRLDVVLAAQQRGIPVDGVHLGQLDLEQHGGSVIEARDRLGPGALIGLTANTDEHLQSLTTYPPGTVDYLGVGAIRATVTKPDHPDPLGFGGFAAFAATAPLPCVAIGGVGPDDAGPLRHAGADGIAVVSAICVAEDPEEVARQMKHDWDQARRRAPGTDRALRADHADQADQSGLAGRAARDDEPGPTSGTSR